MFGENPTEPSKLKESIPFLRLLSWMLLGDIE